MAPPLPTASRYPDWRGTRGAGVVSAEPFDPNAKPWIPYALGGAGLSGLTGLGLLGTAMGAPWWLLPAAGAVGGLGGLGIVNHLDNVDAETVPADVRVPPPVHPDGVTAIPGRAGPIATPAPTGFGGTGFSGMAQDAARATGQLGPRAVPPTLGVEIGQAVLEPSAPTSAPPRSPRSPLPPVLPFRDPRPPAESPVVSAEPFNPNRKPGDYGGRLYDWLTGPSAPPSPMDAPKYPTGKGTITVDPRQVAEMRDRAIASVLAPKRAAAGSGGMSMMPEGPQMSMIPGAGGSQMSMMPGAGGSQMSMMPEGPAPGPAPTRPRPRRPAPGPAPAPAGPKTNDEIEQELLGYSIGPKDETTIAALGPLLAARARAAGQRPSAMPMFPMGGRTLGR